MTPGLRIARAWRAEDGTTSRLAEMINEALTARDAEIANLKATMAQREEEWKSIAEKAAHELTNLILDEKRRADKGDAEIANLRAALGPFASMAISLSALGDHDVTFKASDAKRARDTLAASSSPGAAVIAAAVKVPDLFADSYSPDCFPHHGHRVPGVWDSDNGERAGKVCEACATWKAFVTAVRQYRALPVTEPAK